MKHLRNVFLMWLPLGYHATAQTAFALEPEKPSASGSVPCEGLPQTGRCAMNGPAGAMTARRAEVAFCAAWLIRGTNPQIYPP